MALKLPSTVSIAAHFARSEVRSRYARSVLGSFWITLQQGLFILVAGVVFPGIFGVPVADYVPFFAVSLLFWGFLNPSIIDSQEALIANGPMIRDRGFAPEIFLFAVVFRNLIMSAHALVVPVVLVIAFQATTPWGALAALPGMILFVVTVAAASFALGVIGARFRDLKRVCESALQLAFLVTPILWQPAFAQGRTELVVAINPLAHMFIAWRQPLLDGEMAWGSLGISALIALISVVAALRLARRLPGLAIWI